MGQVGYSPIRQVVSWPRARCTGSVHSASGKIWRHKTDFGKKCDHFKVVLWDSSQLPGHRKGRSVADWEELNSEMKSRASWDNLKIQPSAIIKNREQMLHLGLHGRHNPFQGGLAESLFHPWGRKLPWDRKVRMTFWPAHPRNPFLVSLYLCDGQWLQLRLCCAYMIAPNDLTNCLWF